LGGSGRGDPLPIEAKTDSRKKDKREKNEQDDREGGRIEAPRTADPRSAGELGNHHVVEGAQKNRKMIKGSPRT